MKIKKYILIMLLCAAHNVFAQDTLSLSISDAINMAEEQSIAAFRNKNMYLVDYWDFKNYQALFLPSLNFNSNLVNYQQGNTRQYNSTTKTYEYVPTQDLTTAIGLDITQNIALTGGSFSVGYDLTRLDNFGDNPYNQFSSVPFSISYRQKIFGYNSYKWQRKISPLEFEMAKKEYMYSTEQMYRNVVYYYFNLAQARSNLEIARQKRDNADYRYKMGQKKYELGTMVRVDLLDLEVSLKNAEIEVNQKTILEEQALMNLNSFLNLKPDTPVKLVFDYDVPEVVLDENEILQRALENNPDMLQYKLNLLNAQASLDQAKRNKGFWFDLYVRYGISKIDGGYNPVTSTYEDGQVGEMFNSPFNRYSQAVVGISLPIVDWGRRKGTYKIRKAEHEIANSEYEQNLQNFRQTVLIMVRQFNLLPANIESAAVSDKAAEQSYEIYDKYFKKGETDLIKLMNSITQRESARVNYLNTLYNYWSSYYNMRMITLYDFVAGKDLETDFDKLVGK
ncbi:MAG: TolC family protein [Draconibacterium sp.]